MRLRDARLNVDIRKQSARPIIPATHHEPSLAATPKESRMLRQSQRLFQQPASHLDYDFSQKESVHVLVTLRLYVLSPGIGLVLKAGRR